MTITIKTTITTNPIAIGTIGIELPGALSVDGEVDVVGLVVLGACTIDCGVEVGGRSRVGLIVGPIGALETGTKVGTIVGAGVAVGLA